KNVCSLRDVAHHQNSSGYISTHLVEELNVIVEAAGQEWRTLQIQLSQELMVFQAKMSLLQMLSWKVQRYQYLGRVLQGWQHQFSKRECHQYQMAMKEQHYTYTQNKWVYVATWNVNGQPPTVNLSDWLAKDPEPPDIYAIGFQELDLSKEAFLFNDTPREEEWQEAVLNGLHKKARYHKVALVRLVGMMLLVFVQEQHAAYVRGIATETVGTGIMGKMIVR
ncbi:hypothetical protein L9F63_027248, partial [Diploptera punctata]